MRSSAEHVPADPIRWRLPRRAIICTLGFIVLGLVVAGAAGVFWPEVPGARLLSALILLFDLDSELNVPTWYASSALLFCAGLLAVIFLSKRRLHDPAAPSWGWLAAVFLCLSLDEAAAIHERSVPLVQNLLHPRGLLTFAWVIPGVIFLTIFVLVFLKFLRDLPFDTRVRFVVAGAVYVGGALGLEMVGGAVFEKGGKNTVFHVLVLVEETLEMLGVVIFIDALLRYMESHLPPLTLNFGPDPS